MTEIIKMENNVPKDVLEAVNNVLDHRIKYPIKRLVRMDTKQDKIENKVVAFSNYRIYILTARSPSKVEQSVHFFSIRGMESKKPNQLVISLDDDGKSNEAKNLYFRTMEADTDEINAMVSHIGVSLKQVFPEVNIQRLIKKIDILPSSRLDGMHSSMKELESKEVGPCGGFTQMYNFMCDYHNLIQREEVTWDVDTIYQSSGTKELSLADFDHLDNKDLTPIISSLRHNPWFTVISASGTKLIADNMNELIKVMKKNKVIEELYLAGVGVKFEFANRLSTALLSNSGSPLHTLDISGNQIEDRGIIHLASPLGKLTKGIVNLNLARCSLTPRGINRLAESLGSNKFTSNTLTTLNLSGNSLRGDEITSLCNFLAQPNAIVNLDLSDTECALDTLSGALIRGCTQSLSHVNLSGNVFTNKKVKDATVPPFWKQFFTAAMSIEKVNLSNCKLSADAVKALLAGIGNNRNVQELELDISGNDLRSAGATVIQSNIAEVSNITSLNISDNGFDVDLIGIVTWISRNKAIKDLKIGKNFSNIRARLKPHFFWLHKDKVAAKTASPVLCKKKNSATKSADHKSQEYSVVSYKNLMSDSHNQRHVAQVLESVVQCIQDEESQIQSLSLAGSKLKGDVALLINALGSNTSLTKIDISGNNMGDYGARMLAKALQINTNLQTIYWDHNNTTAQGFSDIANALKNNYTLKYMPTPVCDASKNNSERAQDALEKIESLLHRNHSPRKFNSDKSFRLQHGFLISSTQQMVDRLVLQIEDAITTLSEDSNSETAAKVEKAKLIIKDAENSKHLLLKLQEVALLSEEKGSTLDDSLAAMTNDLKKVVEDQLDRNLKEMLKSAEEQCPTVMEADQESKEEIQTSCEEKSALPKNYVKGLIIHQVGTDLFNKMSGINLSVAAYMSDRIIDTVIEQLTSCHRSLVDCLNSMISSKAGVTATVDKPDNDAEIIKLDKQADVNNEADLLRQAIAANSSKFSEKRKSYLNRRVRPQSFIDPQFSDPNIDLHAVEKHVLEGVKENKAHKPRQPTKIREDRTDGRKEEVDIVLDLPSMTDHLPTLGASSVTKGRPRASRTRPMARPRRPTQNDDEEKVDEGMDAFFESTKVNKEFVQLPDKPEESPPKAEEGAKPTKKTGKFFGLKSKESKDELTPPEKTETKEKSPGKGGFSLGGLIGRKKTSNKEEPKTSSPAKDTKKEEEPKKAAVSDVAPEKPTEEEAKESEPEPAPRRPAGVPKMALPGMGMGLAGGGLLAEMAKKREAKEKRASTGGKSLEGKVDKVDSGARNSGGTPEPTAKPAAAIRSKDQVDKSSSTPPKPVASPRPRSARKSMSPDVNDGKPAITKEKPTLIPPKPVARPRITSPAKDTSGEKVELRQSTNREEEPKRLSIKDRIANLSKAPEHETLIEPNTSQPKSRSLPRGVQPNFAAMIGERPISMYSKPADTSLKAEKKLKSRSRNSRSPDDELEKSDDKLSSTDSLDSTWAKVDVPEVKVTAAKVDVPGVKVTDVPEVKVTADVEVKVTGDNKAEKETEDSEEKEGDVENNNEPTEDKSKPDDEKSTPILAKVDLDDLDDEVTAV